MDVSSLRSLQSEFASLDKGVGGGGGNTKKDIIGYLKRFCIGYDDPTPEEGNIVEGAVKGVPVDDYEDTSSTTPVTTSLKTFPPGTSYLLTFDGGSRGNPGPSGCGCSVSVEFEDGGWVEVEGISEYLGVRTNNQAEYR